MSSVLAIDTTTRGGAVALAQDGEVRAVVHHDVASGYAESLLELCDHVHAQAGATWDALHAIAVVRGPGSFTGLRIGIMTAKTLAFARGYELWAADSLPLLASAAGLDEDATRVALLDAGARHVFAGALPPRTVHVDVERVALADLADWTAVHAPTGEVAVEATLLAMLREHLPGRTVRAADSLAAALGRCASLGRAPAVVADPDGLLPLYASASQAERVHGVDLREHVHRPVTPVRWE